MTMRWTVPVMVALFFTLPSASAQPLDAQPVAAKSPELTDEALQVLGIQRATIANKEAVHVRLAKGIQQFDAGDVKAALRSFQEAADLDTALPDGETLLARMLAQRQAANGETLAARQAAQRQGRERTIPQFAEQRQELLRTLEQRSNQSYEKARTAIDDDRRAALKESLIYARALTALKPEDSRYRFNVAYLLQESGDAKAAQAIMDELAPRNNQGFAKAHLWQADQLLSPDRPLAADALDAAEAHLLQALATYDEPSEIHRRLGELYYYRYVRYNARNKDPWTPNREVYLAKAAMHLEKVEETDTKLLLTLAEIYALQKKTEAAEALVKQVTEKLTQRLVDVPDDIEGRLNLSRVYRMVRKFPEAANVLREGIALRADARLTQELSSIYYFLSQDFRQREPEAWGPQFAALQDAYRAFPTNNYVAHRFFQALTSANGEEAAAARNALTSLVENNAPGSLAPLLLAFDERQQGRADDAEKRLAQIKGAKPDGTPAVLAGLTMAVLSGQVKSLNPQAVDGLFKTAVEAWPKDPDLLSTRAQQHLLLQQYDSARDDLETALTQRPDDAKLHEMMSVTLEKLGLSDQSQKHREQALQLRAKSNAADSQAVK